MARLLVITKFVIALLPTFISKSRVCLTVQRGEKVAKRRALCVRAQTQVKMFTRWGFLEWLMRYSHALW